ncbi:hypothetical protein HOY82DRAFT_606660 [Tuber indicum]|nr:hypothetical protein HOY82DRAFT_606660 [Tuber indicum]
MPRATSSQFRTEHNINGTGGTEKSIISRRQAGDILWRQLRTEVVAHTALRCFEAKFNSPGDGAYPVFHVALDSLIMDVLKKAAESRRNAQLNSDDEQSDEDEGAGRASGSGSRGGRDHGRPQPTLHEERPVRIIFIETTGAAAGQARQLPWVMHGGNTPNKTWLAILPYYTLQELGEAACRELINDNPVNVWLRLSRCTTLTIACFLQRDLVPPADGGDAVRPDPPLDGDNGRYLDPGQFDFAKFYTEPDSYSDVVDDALHRGKRRKGFPRSHAGWQKRIRSNDRSVVRFKDHSGELISRARVKQGPTYMSLYEGQDVQNVALPVGVPPPGCEAPLDGGGDGDADGDGDAESDGDGGN